LRYISSMDLLLHHAFDVTPIGKAVLFSTLTDKEREFVLSYSSVIQLRHGARLFSAGERALRFYMLLEGSIRVFQSREDDRDEELARFRPGDIIGDFDFARQAEYDAHAEALSDSTLIIFPGFGLTLDRISAEKPHAIAQIILGSILMIANRLKEINKTTAANMSWVEELRRRAYEDPGTGLWKQSFLSDEIRTILAAPTALIQLKPDRFKVLVDSRGHAVGDEAMVRIAKVLKDAIRGLGRGWPMRFKSNEVGLFVPHCDAAQAEEIAAAASWLKARVAEGIGPREIGVFVRSQSEIKRASAALEAAAIPFIVLDERILLEENAAALSTMHLAKGLEFRAVAVMACDEDVLPLAERIACIGDESELAEVQETERHLFYVACTRARDALFISSAGGYSEFLDDLADI